MLDYSLAYEYSQSTDAIVEAAMCTDFSIFHEFSSHLKDISADAALLTAMHADNNTTLHAGESDYSIYFEYSSHTNDIAVDAAIATDHSTPHKYLISTDASVVKAGVPTAHSFSYGYFLSTDSIVLWVAVSTGEMTYFPTINEFSSRIKDIYADAAVHTDRSISYISYSYMDDMFIDAATHTDHFISFEYSSHTNDIVVEAVIPTGEMVLHLMFKCVCHLKSVNICPFFFAPVHIRLFHCLQLFHKPWC